MKFLIKLEPTDHVEKNTYRWRVAERLQKDWGLDHMHWLASGYAMDKESAQRAAEEFATAWARGQVAYEYEVQA
ncbi:hypothetical protein GCM10012275_28650 [Longimycelium tulufanense]|uniref:Uncharacterized protein n=1 Tax=Longimycelium tulufanense TaxID=907463 RepID=A0A8J3CBS0_9PSEU|nr:hypothetical protein [Longimycelium tulufanense]GGM55815.1 hypothetical protein GCM10012275_28650 [Longimycelium tulufanense]